MFLPFFRMLLVSTAVAGCATNPYTHRHQLELVPASQELAMGLQGHSQVLSDPKVQISHDPREVASVARVAARIIEAANVSMYAETAKQLEWQVLRQSKRVNLAIPMEAESLWEQQMTRVTQDPSLGTHPEPSPGDSTSYMAHQRARHGHALSGLANKKNSQIIGDEMPNLLESFLDP